MKPDALVTLTFTVQDWRYIAAALTVVKPPQLNDGFTITPRLKAIALAIASETGQGE